MKDTARQVDNGHNRPGGSVFRRRHRLSGGDFSLVFGSRLRKSRGPLTVHLRPNGLGEHRLGLSVGRRFGGAVQRTRFKRLMREVFRLHRRELPTPPGGGAYDIVVTTRAHEMASLPQYGAWFAEAVCAAHRVCQKRDGADAGADDG